MTLLWLGTGLQVIGVVSAGVGVLIGGWRFQGIWRQDVTVTPGTAVGVGTGYNPSVNLSEMELLLAALDLRITSLETELGSKLDHLGSEIDRQKERTSKTDKEIHELAKKGTLWTVASILCLLAGVILTAVATA